MITSLNLIYSKSAAARLLGVATKKVKGFQKWWKVCWVWVEGQRPKFISLNAFKQHFVEHRKEQAKKIYISHVDGNHYRAINPEKGNAYDVFALKDGIDCTCEDFKNQIQFFKKGVCKHGYAALKHLGFDSLSAYIEQYGSSQPAVSEADYRAAIASIS